MQEFDYEQQMRFMSLYNSAIQAQDKEARRRTSRRVSRNNSFTFPGGPHGPVQPGYGGIPYPAPLRRANSVDDFYQQRKSFSRTSSESGYNSNLEYRSNRPLDRRLSKTADTYEGYPKIRRVSVVKNSDDRPPTPPIIKKRSSSSVSMSPSVRFSTVEDIMSPIGRGDTWSGRYKPRMSISSDRDSHVSAQSMQEFDNLHGRRSSSASHDFYGGRRPSSSSHGSHRRSSKSSRRGSVSGRRDSTHSRRESIGSRRASVSSRRSSVANDQRRGSYVSYPGPDMMMINPNGVEGAEIMRRLSKGSHMKEWERSMIMSRRNSKGSRRSSKSSRRDSVMSRRDSRSSRRDSTSSRRASTSSRRR